jgi:hypothetical protein
MSTPAVVKRVVYSDQTILRELGTFEGTGAAQEITHGFGTTWTHLKIELVPLEAGVVFSSFVAPTAGSLDHFHVTVTSGKDWAAVAESW